MIYEYWLASVKGISDQAKKKLRRACKTAKDIYYYEEEKLCSIDFLKEKDVEAIKKARQAACLEENYRKLKHMGIRFLPFFDKEYPKKLSELPDAPYAIYVKGEVPPSGQKAVAIVGARKCTSYGTEMALQYGEELARAGVSVISGMARGIDGAGQRGALNGRGKTYAVLGCGTDICYPREHTGLYEDIQRQGGILSEYLPGTPPLAAHFPRRNRIISALSDVILVMEAQEKSGSLITADMGLEQGKDVYALPGPVTSPMSRGCHRLIAQGAGILLSPAELMEELNIQIVKLCKNEKDNKKMLENPENIVYSCLGLFPKSVSELVAFTGLEPQKLIGVLTLLEIKGLIREVSKNYYIKVRK